MSVFKIRLSLLVILLLPLLVGLGCWQFSRYEQKLILEQTWEYRQSLPPLNITDLFTHISADSDPLYFQLKVTGRFVKQHFFVLDNQVLYGKPGYELILPFVATGGQWLWVNLGWLPLTQRGDIPVSGVNDGMYRLTGTLYRPLGKPFLLKEDVWADSWPKLIQAVDLAKMALTMEQSFLPVLLKLNENQPGALQARPLKMPVSSSKHLGYAVQWFAMAAVLLGLYLFQMKKRG